LCNKLTIKNKVGSLPTLFFLSLLFFYNAQAQYNLVPNPSFEVYVNCPSGSKQPPPPPWIYPTNVTPSYANSCTNSSICGVPYNGFGGGQNYQYARSGSAYITIGFYSKNFANNQGRTYIQTKLNDSLQAGKYYIAGYYINLANTVKYATNNAGVLFTNNSIYVDTISTPFGFLNASPQIINFGNPIIKDTQNWVKISGVFKADGGEKYITIGNFKNDIQTKIDSTLKGLNANVSLVDDVFVIPLDSFNLQADAGRDSTIHIGDSVFIGSLTNGIDTIKWQNQNTGIAIDSTRPGFWVHPLVNTCYVLTQTVNSYTSSDTVCITMQPLPLKMLSFTAMYQPTPSPSKEGNVLLQWQTANEINVSHFNILKSTDGMNFKVIGKVKANNKSYNEYGFTDYVGNLEFGISNLYYRIESVDFDGRKQYSETRTLNLRPQTLNSIIIYPNPAKDYVTVECKSGKELMIIDYFGSAVYRSKIENRPLTVNLKQFAKGLYLVKVKANNGEMKTEKLIVE